MPLAVDTALDFQNEGAPAAPPAGWTRAYTKSDSGLYLKDSANTERKVVTADALSLLHPELQGGISQPGDLAMTSATVSPFVQQINFTLAAANPVYVQSATAGPAGLVSVGFPGATVANLAPPAVPPLGQFMAYGIEIDATGAVQVSNSTAYTTAAFALAALPAAAAGRLRSGVMVVQGTTSSGSAHLALDSTYDVRPRAQRPDLLPVAASADVNAVEGQSIVMTGVHTVYLPTRPAPGATVEVVALTGRVTVARSSTNEAFEDYAGNVTTSVFVPPRASAKYRFLSGTWYTVTGGQIEGATAVTTWVNGWSAYGAAPWLPRFYKDQSGIVHLEGLCTKGAGTWAANEIMFTLPAGYIPPTNHHIFNQACDSVSYELRVYTTGAVLVGGRGGNTNPAGWASLSGVHFRVDA